MSYICNSLFLDGDIDVSSPHHRNHFLWDHTAEDVVLACSRWRLHDKVSVSGHVSTTLAMYYCICDNHHDPIPQKRLMNHLGLYYQDHHHTFLTQGGISHILARDTAYPSTSKSILVPYPSFWYTWCILLGKNEAQSHLTVMLVLHRETRQFSYVPQ